MQVFGLMIFILLEGIVFGGTTSSKTLTKQEMIEEAIKGKDEKALESLVVQEPAVLHWVALIGRRDAIELIVKKIREKGVGKLEELLRYRVEEPAPMFAIQHTHKFVGVALAWSPDGSKLATGSFDKTAKIGDVLGNKVRATIQHKDSVRSVAWSPDGSKLATVSGYSIQIWSVQANKLEETIQHNDSLITVSWSPDGSKLATGSWGGTAQIWDLQEKKVVAIIQHTRSVVAVSWSPDGSKLATGSWDGTAQIWDLQEKKVVAIIQHTGSVGAVSWSPDGSKLATGSFNKTAQIWDLQEKKVVAEMQHKAGVNSVSWNPDGSKLATGSNENTSKIWDVRGNKVIATIQHGGSCDTVSWSPDGSKLATGSWDGTAQIWHMGQTLIDWAVSAVCSGAEKEGLEAVLVLEECADMDGLCSTTMLMGLCHAASKVKRFQPDKYEKLCSVIALIAKKQGASL